MTYYFFPLTEEETENPMACGYRYIKQHEDRLVALPALQDEVTTYDRGTSMIVYKNQVYTIFKDYVVADENKRIYLGKINNRGAESTEDL